MISYYGNKIFSFYPDAKKLQARKMVYPRFVSLWLTTGCNLSCSYCLFSAMNRTPIFADVKKVYKFIDEIVKVGAESLEFSGGGEPTLHKNCFDIAEYAYKKGLKTGLLTNGYNFDFERIKYFSYIRIGLDATDADGYSLIKNCPKEYFQKTLNNVQKLLQVRDNCSKPRIGLKFMLNGSNFGSISKMVQLAKETKVDYCHFKGTHSDSEQLLEEQVQIAKHVLEEQKKLHLDFIYGSVERLRAKEKCFMSPIHTVITPEGNCLVCCYFHQPKYIIGNIFRNKFEMVWNSKRHWDIIDSISTEMCSKVDCRWASYNSEMKEILESDKYDMSFI